ncbi:putative membrane protein [Micromonospora saelicesensis]|uniref:DedA family protein n=1 Tax=Micromonospora saelicesensis TaxID=285676 RepID=UPI000DC5471C|nr:DedA family protein [Micromonospora saelicesensis]RAO41840.1 putative membrane protein [Micromonospora saelicesensis]RAO60115.1 putative membrane protein [Micromonospora saelicesensis]
MIDVQHWLSALPPGVVYLLVAGVIGVESMGVPLPGEIVLVSSALLAATGVVEPEWVASAAAFGAIVGDSVGYAVGRRGGRPLLARLGRRFPKHLGPAQLARAEQSFARHGVWAVFFGRFVALLRILAGPLAGALHVPYRRFLVANAAGGLVWAFGTTYLLYSVGRAAEHWLKDISWAGLVLAVLAGLGSTWWLRRRAHRVASADGAADMTAAEVPSGGQSAGAASGGQSAAAPSGGQAAVVAPGVEPTRAGEH